ncbi:hypothetical protein ACH4UY_23065 [Streptomyces longwoodensis]|uniref:hypothetical protein n=1 Tax=Streptomyces longwoodensis TaxID=68231 RepID=UPI0037B89B11
MAVDPREYEKAMPAVSAELAKLERAVVLTRGAYEGRAYEVVRQALVRALEDEGARRVHPHVVDELARQISRGGGKAEGPG